MGDDLRADLTEYRAATGKKIGRTCDFPGCARTVDDGPLYRVNPKGQPGIFECGQHDKEPDHA